MPMEIADLNGRIRADIPSVGDMRLEVLSADAARVVVRIPADGTYQDGMFGNTWCIKPDFEANAQALHEFIYG